MGALLRLLFSIGPLPDWLLLLLPEGGPRSEETLVRGDLERSSSCEAIIRSLLSCSAAAAAASDCFPRNRRWCTNLVTIESTKLDNEAVISVFNTSARPSRSEPDMGPTELTLDRIMFNRLVRSEGMAEPLGICGRWGIGGIWGGEM